VIFGSNKDYNQLISNQVSVINDHGLLTIKNFKEKNDYIIDNELLIRCFEGNKSDGIDGVNGINKKTILKFFPEVSNVKHTYQNLSDRSTKLIEDEKKTQKVYKKIIDARNILYRNVVLMNLKKPFLNEESLNEISDISSLSLDKDRNIDGIIDLFNKSGYTKHLGDHEINIDSFFSSFHRLKNKELEYSNKIFNT
jgi:5'-3' exonuclease